MERVSDRINNNKLSRGRLIIMVQVISSRGKKLDSKNNRLINKTKTRMFNQNSKGRTYNKATMAL